MEVATPDADTAAADGIVDDAVGTGDGDALGGTVVGAERVDAPDEAAEEGANVTEGVINIDFVPSIKRPPRGGSPDAFGRDCVGVPIREVPGLTGVEGPAPGD